MRVHKKSIGSRKTAKFGASTQAPSLRGSTLPVELVVPPIVKQNLFQVLKSYLIEGPELEFVVDLAKKAAVFIGIFIVGLTLSQVGAFLDARHEHCTLVNGAKLTAHLVTACDILGFGVYVLLSTVRLILRMFQDAGIDVIGLIERI